MGNTEQPEDCARRGPVCATWWVGESRGPSQPHRARVIAAVPTAARAAKPAAVSDEVRGFDSELALSRAPTTMCSPMASPPRGGFVPSNTRPATHAPPIHLPRHPPWP